ncbi:MAG TPA: universal stress protein [Bacteroidales bacterium]|nr:universal stress protein [Bacteroidales bacterium]
MIKNRILVPTNFSAQAEIAFKQSVFFSAKTGADIYLLHIIQNIKAVDKSAYDIETIQNKLNKIADKYSSETGAKIHTRIEGGRIISNILNIEKEIKPSYIFIGTDVSEKVRASTTLRLISQVDCPIVVFAGKFQKSGCENIVLPLDLTKETKQKIDETIKIAKIYNSTVHIVSATNFSDEIERDKLTSQIMMVKSVFDKLDINCKTELFKTKNDISVMANTINDYADDINADLIVIMTRQETKIQKFFVGSMANILIRQSNVPILCISPK